MTLHFLFFIFKKYIRTKSEGFRVVMFVKMMVKPPALIIGAVNLITLAQGKGFAMRILAKFIIYIYIYIYIYMQILTVYKCVHA
jgi:hypothetical protein